MANKASAKTSGTTPQNGTVEIVKAMDPIARAKLLGVEPPLSKAARKLGGVYRVTHGRIAIDSSNLVFAHVGDEVRLNDEDAANMLDADVIEALDARPSRAGKVWAPPPVRINTGAAFAAR